MPFLVFRRDHFVVHSGDHLRLGIICYLIWGSFPVCGSFAVWDHLRRCTALLDSWIAKCPCSFCCHLFRCFDPRFKENIQCHPAFIIRGINSCRKGYSKGRLKSRESDHFNIQIAFNSITKHYPILNLDDEKSAATCF